MNIIRDGSIVVLTSVVSAISRFIGIIVLTRLVSQNELGIFFLFQTILGLLSLPAAFGVNGAIEKRISEGENPEKILSSALLVKILLIGFLILPLYMGKSILNSYVGREVFILIIIGILCQEADGVGNRVLRGEKRVSEASILQSIRVVFWISGSIGLVIIGFGARGIMYALISSHLFVAIISLSKQNTKLTGISTSKVRSVINYAKYNSVTSASGMVYVWMDTAILGIFVGPSLIAAYEVTWRISNISLVISRSVALTTLPQISGWWEEGKNNNISVTITNSLIPSFIIVIPIFFGTVLLSPDILETVYGKGYAVAASAFIVLSFERIIKAGNQICSRCLHAIDRPELSAKASVFSVISNLVLNWFLIQTYGITGAAIGTSFSIILRFAIEYRYLQYIIPFNFPLRPVALITISSSMMMAIVSIILSQLVINDIWKLLFTILIGAISYFLILLLFPSMRKRTFNIFREIT